MAEFGTNERWASAPGMWADRGGRPWAWATQSRDEPGWVKHASGFIHVTSDLAQRHTLRGLDSLAWRCYIWDQALALFLLCASYLQASRHVESMKRAAMTAIRTLPTFTRRAVTPAVWRVEFPYRLPYAPRILCWPGYRWLRRYLDFEAKI
jgi:hypothetical protein